jgi:hypothetical protein
MADSKKKRLFLLVESLKQEHSSFESTMKDCNDYILPTRAKFFTEDTNKGTRKNDKIIDSTATQCANVAAAGLMSGVTSPARVWHKMTVANRQLAQMGLVKRWLSDVNQIIADTFLQSNLYKVLPMCYKDLVVFGTAAIYVERDLDKVLKFKSFPVGSYKIAQDSDGKVNTFVREFKYTVQQIVDEFAEKDSKGRVLSWDNISDNVKSLYQNGQTQEWIEIIHVIKTNDEYNRDLKDLASKYKKFYSCYFESGVTKSGIRNASSDDLFLRESGYDYFPVLCPRWSVTGEDVYATQCPGIDALGDIKQLQLGEMRGLEALDKMINPPTRGPAHLKGKGPTGKLMPGEHVIDDSRGSNDGIKSVYQINLSIRELEEKQAQVRSRIEEIFHKPLFLAFAKADRKSGTTAAEIYEIKDEKLLSLGPTYEQINQDLLDPLMDIAFYEHYSQGHLPPIPQELRGVNLKIEYISLMSQAQKMVGISSIERTAAFIGQMAQFDPGALDKFNIDEVIELYAESTGINPRVIRTDEEAMMIREQKAKALQQQQQMEMLKSGSEAAKNLSDSYVKGDSALSRILGS